MEIENEAAEKEVQSPCKRPRTSIDSANDTSVAEAKEIPREPKVVDACARKEELESVDLITGAWEALQPRVQALLSTVEQFRGTWQASLQQTVAIAARSDTELALEREQLAVARYGADAPLFCTLPPSISILLSASAMNQEELAFAEDVESIANLLAAVRERLLKHIADAKSRADRDTLRTLGPMHTQWGKEIKSLQSLDDKVSRRVTVASRRITTYRSQLKIRDIDPTLLKDFGANFKGYMKVLDFYRHSDAQRFSFNRQLSGPQHFADVRRNVAVLQVWDDSIGSVIFNEFAVSGVDAPGVQPADFARELFVAQEVEDGIGKTYSRDHDAEFKLCSALCGYLLSEAQQEQGSDLPGKKSQDLSASIKRPPSSLRAILFSKKPLCASCRCVVFQQLPERMPGLNLKVVVDESEETEVATREVATRETE